MSATQLINPATEEVLRSVDLCDVAAVDDAVQRARAAQRRWAASPPSAKSSPAFVASPIQRSISATFPAGIREPTIARISSTLRLPSHNSIRSAAAGLR